MKERCYTASGKVVGPCGPCSLINMLGWKGSARLEKSLADIGRVKPFNFCNFGSFLIWSRKYNLNLQIFVKRTAIDCLKSIYQTEKIPANKRRAMTLEATKKHRHIVAQNKNRIHIFSGSPVKKIDSLLAEGNRIAYLVALWRKKAHEWTGHWRVIYKKKGQRYFVKDSAISLAPGLLVLNREQIKKSMADLPKIYASPQIVAFKPSS